MDFISALLDLSFTEFITTKLIKVLYVVLLTIIALSLVGGVIMGLIALFSGDGILQGLGLICLSPIVAFIYVILARVWTELIIVLFRIAENTTEMVQQGRAKSM
ncbi:MAG: DUF4282 domain-containing protein [Chloroflexota bacterium]